MADVASLAFSTDLFDATKTKSIIISDDKSLTIKLYLNAAILPGFRGLHEGELSNSRDVSLGYTLSHAPISVKLLKKIASDGSIEASATLVIEADIDTKVPGTGEGIELVNPAEGVGTL